METKLNLEKEKILHRIKPEEANSKPGKEQCAQRMRGSKVFRLGENVYQVVVYPDAVHYQDKKTGEWIEIDNMLVRYEPNDKGQYLANKTKHRGWFSVLTEDELSYILYRVVIHTENSKRNRKPIWRTENCLLCSCCPLCSCYNLCEEETEL